MLLCPPCGARPPVRIPKGGRTQQVIPWCGSSTRSAEQCVTFPVQGVKLNCEVRTMPLKLPPSPPFWVLSEHHRESTKLSLGGRSWERAAWAPTHFRDRRYNNKMKLRWDSIKAGAVARKVNKGSLLPSSGPVFRCVFRGPGRWK